MAVGTLREVALADAVDVEPHRTLWIVYRDRGPVFSGQILSPHGERVSRVMVDHDMTTLRDRLLNERARETIPIVFPNVTTVVTVGPDDPIPPPLRSALRAVWGRHYGG
jgi:hypothetical protein